VNLWNHLQGLLGDLRFAARSLRRTPGFGVTTIVSLALGVALTASTLLAAAVPASRAAHLDPTQALRQE
jgi:ABC-type lipoprotein release transport system permease subunit